MNKIKSKVEKKNQNQLFSIIINQINNNKKMYEKENKSNRANNKATTTK